MIWVPICLSAMWLILGVFNIDNATFYSAMSGLFAATAFINMAILDSKKENK